MVVGWYGDVILENDIENIDEMMRVSKIISIR